MVFVVAHKGSDEWKAGVVVQCIDPVGRATFSPLSLTGAVKVLRTNDTNSENSRVGEHRSHGLLERRVRTVAVQLRTLLDHIEATVGGNIDH